MIMPGRSAFNLLILFNLIALTTTGCDSGSKSYSGESPSSQNEPGLMEPTPSPGPTPEDNQTPPSLSPNIASFDGTIPLTVTFYANASDKGDIEVYEWDFDGDGNVDITTETDGVDFEFTKPGNYIAQVYVTNSSGNTADASFPRFTVGALEKSCSPSDDYTLSIITGEAVEITPSTVAELERVFCTKYPKMVERFHPEAPRAITVFFENQDASMHSGNYNSHLDQVNLNATTMAAFPVAIDSTFTHELMHAVQEPYSPDRPRWLMEAVAEYGVYAYRTNTEEGAWSFEPYIYPDHFVSGYGMVAGFLDWLDRAYTLEQKNWADELHLDLLNNRYDAHSWSKHTGLSLEQMWADFTSESSYIPAPLPPESGVTLYNSFDYTSDYPVVLAPGTYTINDLRHRGVPFPWDNHLPETAYRAINSLHVPSGYRVLLYPSADLQGEFLEITQDVSLPLENDGYRSVIVELLQ